MKNVKRGKEDMRYNCSMAVCFVVRITKNGDMVHAL